jgi:hypothetical protein
MKFKREVCHSLRITPKGKERMAALSNIGRLHFLRLKKMGSRRIV